MGDLYTDKELRKIARAIKERGMVPGTGMIAALTDVGKIVLALLIFTLILSVFRIL